MELSPEEIQAQIIEFVKAHPKRTHDEIADHLHGITDRQRIIMNVVALSQNNTLDFDRIGWDYHSHTKRYFLK